MLKSISLKNSCIYSVKLDNLDGRLKSETEFSNLDS